MAPVVDSDEKSESSPQMANPTGQMSAGALDGLTESAARRVQVTVKTVGDATDSAIRTAGNYISEIRSTSSGGLQQALEGLERVKKEFFDYEDMVFGKLKGGILIAASHPSLSCGIAAGVGLLAFKRPRRLLWRNTLRFFVSEESLLSNAETKVKVLRQSIDLMKSESKKLEERARMAEEDFNWGQKYLRETRDQMQNVNHKIDSVQKRAEGLKDILGVLSGREAYRLRSQVSSMPNQVKPEKKALEKALIRMSDYGITV